MCYFMSDMEEADREIAKRKLQSNPPEYHFLFATPETELALALLCLLQKLSSENFINFFHIDEVHCIDSWGFHFCSSYSELWKLQEFGCTILAMTGTVTAEEEEEREEPFVHSIASGPEPMCILGFWYQFHNIARFCTDQRRTSHRHALRAHSALGICDQNGGLKASLPPFLAHFLR